MKRKISLKIIKYIFVDFDKMKKKQYRNIIINIM